MATVLTLIKRAQRMLGKLAAGGTPTDEEQDDALEVLNELIDDWKNDKLLTWARQEESLSLSASDGSYTIGPSGDLTTTRPDDIEAAWILEDGITYPVQLLNDQEWAAITVRGQEGDWPRYANYKPTMANGTLSVYPVPNAARTLMLLTRVPVSEFSTVSDTVSLPPGFRRALSANLAIAMAPEYEVDPPAAVVKMATESKKRLIAINARPIKAHNELALMNRSTGNILSGP